MKCIAIDDEPLALKKLTGYIEKTPFLELVKACHSPLEAIDTLVAESVDLVFVDINMPYLNGLDFVKSLTNRPIIIFTTAYSEYALDGFKVGALDYLLKPFSYNDFLQSVNKALRQYELVHGAKDEIDTDNVIFVKSGYKTIRLNVNDITYIESQNEYVRIYLENDKPVMTLLSMKSLEERLPIDRFMRVHRSYIVNLAKITEISRNRIVYGKDVYIPVGDQYKERFYQYLDKCSLK